MKPFSPVVFILYLNDESVWIAMVTILNNKYMWFFNKSLLFLLKYCRKLMHHPNIKNKSLLKTLRNNDFEVLANLIHKPCIIIDSGVYQVTSYAKVAYICLFSCLIKILFIFKIYTQILISFSIFSF